MATHEGHIGRPTMETTRDIPDSSLTENPDEMAAEESTLTTKIDTDAQFREILFTTFHKEIPQMEFALQELENSLATGARVRCMTITQQIITIALSIKIVQKNVNSNRELPDVEEALKQFFKNYAKADKQRPVNGDERKSQKNFNVCKPLLSYYLRLDNQCVTRELLQRLLDILVKAKNARAKEEKKQQDKYTGETFEMFKHNDDLRKKTKLIKNCPEIQESLVLDCVAIQIKELVTGDYAYEIKGRFSIRFKVAIVSEIIASFNLPPKALLKAIGQELYPTEPNAVNLVEYLIAAEQFRQSRNWCSHRFTLEIDEDFKTFCKDAREVYNTLFSIIEPVGNEWRFANLFPGLKECMDKVIDSLLDSDQILEQLKKENSDLRKKDEESQREIAELKRKLAEREENDQWSENRTSQPSQANIENNPNASQQYSVAESHTEDVTAALESSPEETDVMPQELQEYVSEDEEEAIPE